MPSLPLPGHLSTLLSLHSAVEHALIVHLATSGGNAVDSSTSATSSIQLPSVITYTTLRPIVERSCGRRLGVAELSRLMWVWGCSNSGNNSSGSSISSSSSSSSSNPSAGSNIGFHITKGKTMDRAGNRSYDYYFSLQVGLDLDSIEGGDDIDRDIRIEKRDGGVRFDDDDDEGVTGRTSSQRKRIASGEIIPTTPPRKRVRPLDLPEEPQTPSPSPRSISVFGGSSSSRQRQSSRNSIISPSLNSSPSKMLSRSPRIPSSPTKSGHQRSRSISANSLLLSSSSSPGGLVAATSALTNKPGSLALVAMWNSGIEGRKRIVRKRLLRWTMNYYETWLREAGKESQTDVKRESSRGQESTSVKIKGEEATIERRPCTPPPLESSRRAVTGEGGMLTPSATREDDWVPGRKRVVDLFATVKEEEDQATSRSEGIQEWDPDFPLDKVAPIPQASLPEVPPSPAAGPSSSTRAALLSASLRKDVPSKPALSASSSVAAASKSSEKSSIDNPGEKKLTLAERIKAKEEAKRSQMAARAAGPASGRGGFGLGLMDSEERDLLLPADDLHTSRSSMMARLKRKSALSRLQDVAESLYMLFSSKATTTTTTTTSLASYPTSNLESDQEMSATTASTSNPTTPTKQQTKRYPYLPINDVTKSICTSSKVTMSDMEARESFKMLQEIAPGFLEINRVGAKEWIRMGSLTDGSGSGSGGGAGASGGLLTAVRTRIRAEMERS